VQGGCDLRVSVLFCVKCGLWSPRRREEKKKFVRVNKKKKKKRQNCT